VNSVPLAIVPVASLTIWWFVESWFTHVTVVPFGTRIFGGENTRFWISIVGSPGSPIGVVVGSIGVVDNGLWLEHPLMAITITRTTIRIAQ